MNGNRTFAPPVANFFILKACGKSSKILAHQDKGKAKVNLQDAQKDCRTATGWTMVHHKNPMLQRTISLGSGSEPRTENRFDYLAFPREDDGETAAPSSDLLERLKNFEGSIAGDPKSDPPNDMVVGAIASIDESALVSIDDPESVLQTNEVITPATCGTAEPVLGGSDIPATSSGIPVTIQGAPASEPLEGTLVVKQISGDVLGEIPSDPPLPDEGVIQSEPDLRKDFIVSSTLSSVDIFSDFVSKVDFIGHSISTLVGRPFQSCPLPNPGLANPFFSPNQITTCSSALHPASSYHNALPNPTLTKSTPFPNYPSPTPVKPNPTLSLNPNHSPIQAHTSPNQIPSPPQAKTTTNPALTFPPNSIPEPPAQLYSNPTPAQLYSNPTPAQAQTISDPPLTPNLNQPMFDPSQPLPNPTLEPITSLAPSLSPSLSPAPVSKARPNVNNSGTESLEQEIGSSMKKSSSRKSTRIRRPPTNLKNMVGLSGNALCPTESAELTSRLKKSLIMETDRMEKVKAEMFIKWINTSPDGEILTFALSCTKVKN